MKLLECYIQNFGKISERRFNFTDGFNRIVEENGFGKTTLSVFIKVMLYGMGDTRKPNLAENDRKHYLPWQGGVCGGTLTFSVGKKKYRIERSFGARASEDELRLIDLSLGRATDEIKEPIGESLLGIDVEGFERTVFLSERFLGTKNDNKSISAKLSDLVGSDGDIGAMDTAVELLENQRKFYQKKGGVGEIANVKDAIYAVEDEIRALERAEEELSSEEERLSNLEKQIKEKKNEAKSLGERRESAVLSKAREEGEARHRKLQESLLEKTRRRDEIIELFGGSIPTFNEINELAYKASEVKRLTEGDGGASEEYTELRAYFSTDLTPYDIERAEGAVRRIRAKEATEEKRRAAAIFKKRVPKESEVDELISLWEKGEKNSKNASFSLLISGILLIICSIILSSLISPALYSLSALGIVLSIISLRNMRSGKNEFKAREERTREFYSSLSDESLAMPDGLYEIKNLLSYAEKNAGKSEDEKTLSALVERCKESGEDKIAIAEKIITDYKRYFTLRLSEEYKVKESERSARLADDLAREVAGFLSNYKLKSDDPFNEMRENLLEYNRLSAGIVEARREITAYESKNALGEECAVEKSSLDEIKALSKSTEDDLSKLMREHALIERHCQSLTEQLEAKNSLTIREAELSEKLSEYEENYRILMLTKKYLTEAKDAVTAKYLGKTKESFLGYVKTIGAIVGEFDMDTSFAVSKQEGAKARPLEAYSRGTRDLFNLAARFALVDSLYEGEAPFMILDDPFISFDDKKAGAALALVREIAKKRQIIYFTCSEAR